MTARASVRRVTLAFQEEDLLPLPLQAKGEGRDKVLAAWLREVFTRPGGRLEARAGAVLLDGDDRSRVLTAPFVGEWPPAEVQALLDIEGASEAGIPLRVERL